MRRVKETECFVAFDFEKELEARPTQRVVDLPDGTSLKIGTESFVASEVLFDPARAGSTALPIQQCLTHAISKVSLMYLFDVFF